MGECVGQVPVCRKPSDTMQYKQLQERCSLTDQCSPNGLVCHHIEEDYYKCIKESIHPTTSPPTTTSTAPTTTVKPTGSKCFVCYWNCEQFGANWEAKAGSWENASANHCAATTGGSTCFCYGVTTARACYDSFSRRSGTSCSSRLII